jgi:peroxin-1
VVKLSGYQAPSHSSSSPIGEGAVFLGWTGMQTKSRVAPVVGRDGLANSRGSSRDQNVNIVEMDATYGRLLGLLDGQKVCDLLGV